MHSCRPTAIRTQYLLATLFVPFSFVDVCCIIFIANSSCTLRVRYVYGQSSGQIANAVEQWEKEEGKREGGRVCGRERFVGVGWCGVLSVYRKVMLLSVVMSCFAAG